MFEGFSLLGIYFCYSLQICHRNHDEESQAAITVLMMSVKVGSILARCFLLLLIIC